MSSHLVTSRMIVQFDTGPGWQWHSFDGRVALDVPAGMLRIGDAPVAWAERLIPEASPAPVLAASKVLLIIRLGLSPRTIVTSVRAVPASMLAPMLVLAAATIYFGLDTRATVDVSAAAANLLLGGSR